VLADTGARAPAPVHTWPVFWVGELCIDGKLVRSGCRRGDRTRSDRSSETEGFELDESN
jgi:hypothetical protein